METLEEKCTAKIDQKKIYHSPELIIYGDIRQITQMVGNAGNLDGGSGHTNRSQP